MLGFGLALALLWVGPVLAEGAAGKGEAGGPVAEIALPGGGTCHVQGVTVMGERLFVTCVDRISRRALLLSYKLPSGFPAPTSALPEPERKDLTVGSMYHPSGLDHDGKCVWVAVANYRSFMARSKIMCLSPADLSEEKAFEVEDHIGGLAVMGETLLALNWDAKVVYRFSKDGQELGKDKSPGSVAYQDCQGVSDHEVLCSGPEKLPKKGKPAAVVELIGFDPLRKPAWKVEKQFRMVNVNTSVGNEGFAVSGPYWLFLPEDFPKARLIVYPRPE